MSSTIVPVEVVRDQSLVGVINDFIAVITGNLGPVTGVEKNALITGLRIFEQPCKSLADCGRGRTLIKENTDIFRIETDLLKCGAHFEDVVYAALKAIVRIGIVVDADKQSAARCARRHRSGDQTFAQILVNIETLGFYVRAVDQSLQKDARLRQPGNLAPDLILCVCVPNALDCVVISDS